MAKTDNSIYMDTDRVTQMAGWFQTASGTLKAVSNALKAVMEVLKATALIGLVGGMALERYIATIQPPIEEMSEYCAELSRDLKSAVDAFTRADHEGAGRFS